MDIVYPVYHVVTPLSLVTLRRNFREHDEAELDE